MDTKRIIIVVAASVLAVGGYMSIPSTKEVAKENAEENNVTWDQGEFVVAVVGDGQVGNSWPGEIISPEVAQIQPQREGVITDWRVRIGDTVTAGEVLGKISAPPAMPELVAMLAEKAEELASARGVAAAAEEFAAKEQKRFDAMSAAVRGEVTSSFGFALTALQRMREKAIAERDALRAFIEGALTRHVTLASNVFDWGSFRPGSFDRQYGILNGSVQNEYETAFIMLAKKLKENPIEAPIKEAQDYFALFVRLASNSLDEMSAKTLKMTASEDQEAFFKMLKEYRMAQAEAAEEETEYQLMVAEQGAMIAKDVRMARAEVAAMEESYNIIAKSINGGAYIVAPRSGVVSAIYKKVGDLVSPMMSVAMITGGNRGNVIARIQIPNNVRRPKVGETMTVMRPGFSNEKQEARIVGVGTSLDEMGSYMADAVFTDTIDWPIGASIRALAAADTSAPVIGSAAVWTDKNGEHNVWGVSEAGRMFAKKVSVGRTLGSLVEIYGGLHRGESYVANPTADVHEDMLIEDAQKTETKKSTKSGGHDSMPGM